MPRYRYNVPTTAPRIGVQQPVTKVSEGKGLKKIILYLVIIIGIILVGLIIYMLNRGGSSKEVIDLSIIEIDDEIEVGGELNYEIEALNLGKKDEYDLILKHDIYNSEGQYFPTLRKEESVTLEKESVFTDSMIISLSPGTYRLKITATHESGGESATVSKTFEIVEVEDGNNNGNENGNSITPIEPVNASDDDVPDDGGDDDADDEDDELEVEFDFQPVTGLTDRELEARALEKAGVNVEDAINHCLSISIEANQDYCLLQAAKKSEKDFFCRMIDDSTLKDGCYMELALKGKASLCSKIKDGYNKETCEALT